MNKWIFMSTCCVSNTRAGARPSASINLADNAVKILVEREVADGTAFIVQQVRRILADVRRARTALCACRSSVEALRFPFQRLRPYQDAMMEQVRLAIPRPEPSFSPHWHWQNSSD